MVLASEKKILVVDDEPDVRNFLAACLEDAGFLVETAVDGLDALEKIEASQPDLITLDLVMPRMSGVKLKRRLRKNEDWSKIPIIIITAHAKDELGKRDVNEFYAVETKIVPEHILEKPVTPSKLIEAISKILSVEVSEDLVAERTDIMNMIKFCKSEKLEEIRNILT